MLKLYTYIVKSFIALSCGQCFDEGMKVKFIWHGKETTVETEDGRTFLDLALMAGISPPYSCTEGHCGTCEAVTDKGETIRTCQTLPKSELQVIDYDKAQHS